MITNDEQLAVVKEQIERLERSVRALRTTVLPLSLSKFRLMADPLVEDLAILRSQADMYLGVTAATEAEASMVLSLEGENVRLGETRGSVVTRTVEAVRKGVRGILAALQDEAVQLTTSVGRPRWIDELADLPIAQLAPGSVRIVLGEPSTTELYSSEQRTLLSRAIAHLSRAAAAAESPEQLSEAMRDTAEPLRNAVLLALRDLAPPRQSEIESVVFSSRFAASQSSTRVTKRTRSHVAAAMRTLGTALEEYVFLEGDVREVDLDNNAFTLRNTAEGQSQWICEYENEFAEEVVALLGSRVSVAGERLRSQRPRLQVLALTPIEEPDAGSATEGGT